MVKEKFNHIHRMLQILLCMLPTLLIVYGWLKWPQEVSVRANARVPREHRVRFFRNHVLMVT